MAIAIKDLFSHAFVLSLSNTATDIFRGRFARYFHEDANLIRPFYGYKIGGLDSRTNILVGHTAIVRMAKAMDWPFVWIFESDAFPRRDAVQRLTTVLSDSAIPSDTKVLWLGWCAMRHGQASVNGYPSLVRPRRHCAGAQAWIIFKQGYDMFLQRNNTSNTHVDVGFGAPQGLYILRESIFCQADTTRSSHNHSGYSGGGRWSVSDPPNGFDRDPDCDRFIQAGRKGNTGFTPDNLVKFSSLFRGFPHPSSKCLVIGSNKSILQTYYEREVNEFDGDVIRVNNTPDQRYKSNYGDRVDMVVGSRWYQNHIRIADVPSNKIYTFEIEDIIEASNLLRITPKRLTDGMVIILLAMAKYKEVNVLGFGDADIRETGMYHSIHNNRSDSMSSSAWVHDLQAEHEFIREMATSPVPWAGTIVEW